MATISVTHTCLDNTTKYTRQDEMLLLNKLGARSFVSLDQRSQLILAHIYYRAEQGEAEAKSLANRCTKLETLNGELVKEKAALEAKNAVLEAEKATMKVANKALRADLSAARIENDELRREVQGKNLEIRSLRNQNKALNTKVDGLAKRIDNLESGSSSSQANRPGSYAQSSFFQDHPISTLAVSNLSTATITVAAMYLLGLIKR